jgi:uncharacterized protein (DUF2267 family)
MVEDRPDAPNLATEAALDVLRELMTAPEAQAALAVLLDGGERWRSRALDLLELVDMKPGAADAEQA